MSLRERLRGLKKCKFFEEIYFFFYRYSITLCTEKIPKWSGRNRILKRILLIVLFPYIFLKGIICYILEAVVFSHICRNEIKKDNEKEYKYDFAIAVIVKNEASYLREWVAYHRVACEDKVHFFIYDNDSVDNTRTTIKDYIEEGIVTYIPFGGVEKQLPAYNDAIAKNKDTVRYMAIIDADEFIVSQSDENLTDHICEILKTNKAAGIGINWKLFGSSGYKEKQPGLVTETFLKHGEESHWGNTHVKTICNPRFVKKYVSPHYPEYKLGAWSISPNGKRQNLWWNKNVSWSDLAIHHYFCKSLEEYAKKKGRGFADKLGGMYDDKRYIQYDQNQYHDDIMLKYTEKIKKIMDK